MKRRDLQHDLKQHTFKILQGGSLKGTGAVCPHVLQDKPAGKTTSLAEQRALAGTQEKKEGLPPMEERA